MTEPDHHHVSIGLTALAFQVEEPITNQPFMVEDLYTTFVSSILSIRIRKQQLETSRGKHNADQSCCFEGGPGILVLYTYHESQHSARNLRFFLDQTAQDWAVSDECQTGPRLELVLVISGHFCSVALPSAGNVRVLRVDDSGTDFGAFADALDALGISLEAQGWRRQYKYFVFIDSSCRGPFLPSYALMLHWTDPFTSKITEEVKLVGPSIHFIPGVAASRCFAQ